MNSWRPTAPPLLPFLAAPSFKDCGTGTGKGRENRCPFPAPVQTFPPRFAVLVPRHRAKQAQLPKITRRETQQYRIETSRSSIHTNVTMKEWPRAFVAYQPAFAGTGISTLGLVHYWPMIDAISRERRHILEVDTSSVIQSSD